MNSVTITAETSYDAGCRVNRALMRWDSNLSHIDWRFGLDNRSVAPQRVDYALVAYLPQAMRLGRPVKVLGPVSRTLIESLEECVDAWSLWRPDLFHRISIEPTEIVADQSPSQRDAVITFSGGVDATFALAANKTGLLNHRGLDIQCAVMVHGFDIPLDKPEWFEKVLPHATAILSEFGVPCSTVATNWKKFSVDWEMCFGFGVAAVLHQYCSSYSWGLWAADEPYHQEIFPWGNNSVTNPLMSGLSFPIRACGGGYTRTEKASVIGRWDSVRKHIRVCWERPEVGGNCGQCEKCVRTQLNFLAAGYSSMEAFGTPLTSEQVRAIRCTNEPQRKMLENILRQHGEKLPQDIADALELVVSQPLLRMRLPLKTRVSRRLNRICRAALGKALR